MIETNLKIQLQKQNTENLSNQLNLMSDVGGVPRYFEKDSMAQFISL
jgi:hypothetical protein